MPPSSPSPPSPQEKSRFNRSITVMDIHVLMETFCVKKICKCFTTTYITWLNEILYFQKIILSKCRAAVTAFTFIYIAS